MSTPFLNSVPVTYYTRAPGNAGALQDGAKWGGAYGTGVTLTYSFPGKTAFHVLPYGNDEFDSYYPLTGTEKAAVRSALAEWGAVARIKFVEVADRSTVAGDLRFAVTDVADDEVAHAYLPWEGPEGGDVWFKNGEWHTAPGSKVAKGSYDYLAVLHEIGHAIGLKHPFKGPQKLSYAYDSFAYTVMSYSAAPGKGSYASFYPTTPMYYDILNIQGIYGRGVHNPGNTVYKFKSNGQYWQTIDDSGGKDTIVHDGKGKAQIDLNVGHWSDLGKSILFKSGSTKWTVMIGPGTVIENAIGGKGKDTLVGNDVRNVLSGRGGKDKLTGGDGNDVFVFNVKFAKANRDVITDFKSGEDMIHLAKKFVRGVNKGPVSSGEFADHFKYDDGGTLSFRGKAIVKLLGAPALDHHDLFVV